MPSARRVASALAAVAILASCARDGHGAHQTPSSVGNQTATGPNTPGARSDALITTAELRTVPGLPAAIDTQSIDASGVIPTPRGPCGATINQPNLSAGQAVAFTSPSGIGGYELTATLPATQATTYMNQLINNLRAGCPYYTIHTNTGSIETFTLTTIVDLSTNADQAIAYTTDTTLIHQTTHTAEIDLRKGRTYAYLVLTSTTIFTAPAIQSLAQAAAKQLTK